MYDAIAALFHHLISSKMSVIYLIRLEEAITLFNKSLTEHRNAETLKKLNEAEKALKDKKEK